MSSSVRSVSAAVSGMLLLVMFCPPAASYGGLEQSVPGAPKPGGVSFYSLVSWESINRSPPADPSVGSVHWWLSADNLTLEVENPETGEWVFLKYQGVSMRGDTIGKMFNGRSESGCVVQLTLFGKPAKSPAKYEFSLFLTTSSRERILYGNCPEKLRDCFEAQR